MIEEEAKLLAERIVSIFPLGQWDLSAITYSQLGFAFGSEPKGKILETAYRRVSRKTALRIPALYFHTIFTLEKFLFQLEYLLQSLQKAKSRLQNLKALESQVLL